MLRYRVVGPGSVCNQTVAVGAILKTVGMTRNALTTLDFEARAEVIESQDLDNYDKNLQNAAREFAETARSQSALIARLLEDEERFQLQLGRRSWGRMLDEYVGVLILAKQTGEWFVNNAPATNASTPRDPRWWPVVTLNARLWRVGFEVHTLLRAGFGKGALARARTMYEAALTARIIGELGAPGSDTADLGPRYQASEQVERYRDALEYNKHASESDRFSDAEIARWREERDQAVATWGKSITRTNGWAHTVLPDVAKITVPHLEGLVDWQGHRPFYRLANHEVHPTSRGGVTNTYVDLGGSTVHSTGRRFRALGEPASMATTYLTQGLVSLIADTGVEPETKTTLALATEPPRHVRRL